MPIPNPRQGEDKDGFVQRCMGDANITTEFPDQTQRAAVCNAQWEKSLDAIADTVKNGFSKDNTVEAEIFAVGKWNGLNFTKEDLQGIADTFNELSSIHKVPLKFGHNSKQPMTDGQPSLGWVSDVWVSGNKLMAKFSQVPEIVMNAIRKGLYKRVSIELDRKVKHKSKFFENILSGVALLGADIPAVNTLEDLNAFMSRSEITGGEHVSFSAITGNIQEGQNMSDVKELEAKLAEAEAKAAKFAANAEKAEAELQAKVDADQREAETARKNRIEFNREAVIEVLEDAVKSNSITPAQRDLYTKTLQVNDDIAMEHIIVQDVKELVGAMDKNDFSSSAKNSDPTDQAEGSADEQLVEKINDIRDENPDMDFSTAMEKAMRKDKELAKRYFTSVK